MIKYVIRNLKVKTKIILLAVILLVATVIMALVSINNQIKTSRVNLERVEEQIRQSYDINIKNQVENVISLLDGIEAKRAAGEYTLEEAQKLAADMVRGLKYGDSGYFWIDTYEGVNVVLLGKDTEGTNRYESQDVNGFYHIKALIAAGQQEGGGFTDYWFPKAGEEEALPKRGYTLAFEPYQWIIGTGNYTDYIDNEVSTMTEIEQDKLKSGIISFSIIVVIAVVLATGVAAYIIVMLNKDFSTISKYFDVLAKGDFTAKLPDSYTDRKDDFGMLARDLEIMKNSVGKLVGSTKVEAEQIHGVVGKVNGNVNVLNDNISDVAATTEELAASMEETAASAITMASTAQEIETAVKTIAEKSQEAALQVVGITKRAKETKDNVKASQENAVAIGVEIEKKLQKALEQSKVIEQIHVLTDSIMSITAQTNLLALNAAVEAARAGEAGKGFAVVAEEVRNLAMRSAEAAKNTARMIEESVNNSRNGVQISGQVKAALDEIVQGISKTTDLVGEIAAASKEQAQGIDQINTAVSQMDKVTQQNAANAEESASASEELNAQAFSMKEIVASLDGLINGTNHRIESSAVARKAPAGLKSRELSLTDKTFHAIADGGTQGHTIQTTHKDFADFNS